jgi:hypothetical protein
VPDHLGDVWTAFWALSGDRQYGAMGGVGPIPFAAIDRYAARFGVDEGEDFARFHTLIKRMDRSYLEWIGKQGEAEL